ncbi:transcription elongation factor SPT5-like isoform X2 [Hylaeus volcanicus]|uniref:transcription elongation factor SPT5-like isoform X2 n=1 Tax=Hylaeus volcanicus TaxID=313075 RepID=UPI0023B82EA8|nr:transcription elongation factor SPT5-like isoform X2 [Hylaeus volcanicus]
MSETSDFFSDDASPLESNEPIDTDGNIQTTKDHTSEENQIKSNEKTKKSRHGKKRKTTSTSASHVMARNFIDTEALVEDDDEEDESETEELKQFSDENDLEPDDEVGSDHLKRRKIDVDLPSRKEYRGSKTHLQTTIGDLERRYQDQTGTDDEVPVSEDDVDYDSEHQEEDGIHETYRYPLFLDAKNAHLWKIRTIKGVSSQDVVIGIMNKCMCMKKKKKSFPLLSAFAPKNIKGHIYVEASNLAQIKRALYGLKSLILSSIKIVPVADLNNIFGMGEQRTKQVHRHELVRIRGGIYANDLAQVTNVDDSNTNVWVRLVPRINLTDLCEPKAEPIQKKKQIVANLLLREAIEAKGGTIDPGPHYGTFRFQNKLFTESGYLIKHVLKKMLITGAQVAVTDEEVKEFGKGLLTGNDEYGSYDDLLAAVPHAKLPIYNIGDNVLVHSGDIAGVTGCVVAVNGKTVNVQLDDKSFQNEISVETHSLTKLFKVGDSVKIVGGQHKGASGLITSVDREKTTAAVFYPTLGKPLKCFLNDLQICSDISIATTSTLSGFCVGDFVQLSEQEPALIVRIDTGGAFVVLTIHNQIHAVPLSRVTSKCFNEFAVCVDRHRYKFGIKAVVTTVLNGKKISGRVCHIWKNHVFLKLNTIEEGHYGFMVCDSKDVSVRAADTTQQDHLSWQKTSTSQRPSSSNYNTPHHSNFRKLGPRGGRQWVGNRVRIISGRNKGSFGVILATESGGRLRIQLSQNDIAACFTRNELIILDENDHKRKGRYSDARSAEKDTSQWSNYFQDVLLSTKSSSR